jgi:hypothetical protein
LKTGLLKFLLFLIIVLACNQYSNSQNYSYRQYTVFDGLMQTQVTAVYQDSYGFIWAGTKEGVCRFDGKNFMHFTNPKGFGWILSFFEFNNQLYCHTNKKILQLRDDRFVEVFDWGEGVMFGCDLYEESGSFFIWGTERIVKITAKERTTYHLPNHTYILSFLYLHNEEKMYFSGINGFFEMAEGKNPVKINEARYNFLSHIDEGRIFVYQSSYKEVDSKYHGIFEFCEGEFCPILLPENCNFFDGEVLRTGDEYIFTCNRSVWVRIDQRGNILDKDSLADVVINDICIDRNGLLWLGTEQGLFMLQSYAFRNYEEKSGMPKHVWSIFEDHDENIVFASFTSKLVKMKNGLISEVPNYKNYLGEGDQFYVEGFCNSLGQWMIPTNDRIFVYDKGNISLIKLMHNELPACALACFEDTTQKKIYFGTTMGLFVYDLKTGEYENFQTDNANILDIERDTFGRLWVCTNKDVRIFENQGFSEFKENEKEVKNGVISCVRDSKGNMWLARKDGLYVHFYSNEVKVHESSFYFLKVYDQTHILAGGVHGMIYIDIESLYAGEKNAIQQFDRYNGFLGRECGQNGTCIDSRSQVWIPASESVVLFDPHKIQTDTFAPPAYIYSFDVSGSDLQWTSYTTKRVDNSMSFETNHTKNNIRITYHAIALPCPERVKYSYRLKGYDDSWIESTEESVVYTNLRPGNYEFQLIAENEHGYRSKTAAKLSFYVSPAFWQTLLFKIAALLIAAGIGVVVVLFIVKRRRENELRKSKLQQQLLSMQLSAINAQLDPHFVFNTITAIASEVQENKTEKAYSYFVKMSNLLRSSLNQTGEIVRPLSEEIDFVTNYLGLQKFRFEQRFDYEFIVEKNVSLIALVPRMCIQLFVENAVKHGLENTMSGGLLKIHIHQDDKGLHVEVEDNGVGRKSASERVGPKNGIGLKMFTEFFDIMNKFNEKKAGFQIADLFDNEQNAKGTKVYLFIPEGYKYATF